MAIGLMASGAAHGQLTGTRLPGSSAAMVGFTGIYDEGPLTARPSDEALEAGRNVAYCMVRRRRATVVRYLTLASVPDRKPVLTALQESMTTCLGGIKGAREMRFGETTLQGALAEALLNLGPVPALAAVEPSKTAVPTWLSSDTNQRVVQEMSICLAERYPLESLSFVRSNAGSTEESRTFAALAPNMGPCLVRGASLKTNRGGMRLAIATALYHRAEAAQLGQTATTIGEGK